MYDNVMVRLATKLILVMVWDSSNTDKRICGVFFGDNSDCSAAQITAYFAFVVDGGNDTVVSRNGNRDPVSVLATAQEIRKEWKTNSDKKKADTPGAEPLSRDPPPWRATRTR